MFAPDAEREKEGPYYESCYEARVQLSPKFIQYIMGVLGFGEKVGGGGGGGRGGGGAGGFEAVVWVLVEPGAAEVNSRGAGSGEATGEGARSI